MPFCNQPKKYEPYDYLMKIRKILENNASKIEILVVYKRCK